MRTIDKIVKAEKVMMGNFEIMQPLPAKGFRQVDPFLLIHHAGPVYHKPGTKGLNVEAHPHTGFEPVTFVFNGEVEHRDSLGNNSIVRSGGVQWINAGKGIVHSEKASKKFLDTGGEFEIIQLWINLARKYKKTNPSYIGLEAEDIPTYRSDDLKCQLNVVAGAFKDITGPVKSLTGITAYTGYMESQGTLELSFDVNENVLIYLLGGEIQINDRHITGKHLVIFKNDGKEIIVESSASSKLLILSGIPIKEPVFHYGPFVLNSKDEVIEALNDYESGKMGHLS